MKTKPESNWKLNRPVWSACWIIAVLSLLFSITAPYADVAGYRWLYIIAGLAYSAFLSFGVVGISLLPANLRRRVFISLFIAQTISVLIMGGLYGAAYFNVLQSFLELLHPAIWLLYISGGLFVVFACYGWYFHSTEKP